MVSISSSHKQLPVKSPLSLARRYLNKKVLVWNISRLMVLFSFLPFPFKTPRRSPSSCPSPRVSGLCEELIDNKRQNQYKGRSEPNHEKPVTFRQHRPDRATSSFNLYVILISWLYFILQVSGEYAMLHHAAKAGSFSLKEGVQESLTAFHRAGNCVRGWMVLKTIEYSQVKPNL